MADKKKVGLSDMMDGTPRHNTTLIDVTQGKVEKPIEEKEETPVEVKKTVTAESASTEELNKENLKEVNPFDILPPKKVEKHTFEDELMGKLDMAVEREKESITERIDAITEKQREEFEEAQEAADLKRMEEEDKETVGASLADGFDDEDSEGDYGEDEENISIFNEAAKRTRLNLDDTEEPATPIKEEKVVEEASKAPVKEAKKEEVKDDTTDSILSGIDDKDLFDDEDDDDSSEENTSSVDDDESEKQFEELKSEVKKKINPIRKAFDLSKFTIAQKSMNAQKVMKLAVQQHQNIADWVLYSEGRPISLSGLSGPEILKLNPENSSRNRLNTFRDMYRIIYDHICDANKPEFETWLKRTHFIDIQHIYFGLYMATFGGSNFITYSCTNDKCNNVFIKDIKFEDMIKYKDDSVKKKVQDILKMDTTSAVESDEYETDLIQISDNYVFAIKTPTIWNVIMETATLSDKFLEKHADLIDLVSYIDKIYLIDAANQRLIPVDTKPDPNDQAKTSARRIRAFYDVISTLNSEDFYNLRAKIAEYDKASDELSYQIPACTCPKCATEIAANESILPENMLFTRHQLAAIGNM